MEFDSEGLEGEVVPPPWECTRNHPGAEEHRPWTDASLRELVEIGAVTLVGRAPRPGAMVAPLNVVPKSVANKFRLIHDLRVTNKGLVAPKFSLDSLDELRHLFTPGAWLIGADLSSGYYHIEVHPSSCRFMSFKWQFQLEIDRCVARARAAGHVDPEREGCERAAWSYLEWCVLPFGLTTAPWFFSMVMRAVCVHLRGQGLTMIQYIDDCGWVVVGSHAEACKVSERIVREFALLGLSINWD